MDIRQNSAQSNLKVACNDCSLSTLCVVNGLSEAELESFERTIETSFNVQKDDILYRAGDPMHSIFAIKSGAFKSSFTDANGNLQVTGFYLPGELIGFEGLANKHYQCDIVALDQSRVCELPTSKLDSMYTKFPALQREMTSLNNKRLNEVLQLLMLVSKRPVEERLAVFLLNMIDRYKMRGIDTTRFHLPMSWQDIANFLGMAPETLSRQLGLFQKNQWIKLENKDCTILDAGALRERSKQYN